MTNFITYTIEDEKNIVATISPQPLQTLGFVDYEAFQTWLTINNAVPFVAGGYQVEKWENYRGLCCSECYEMLTGVELDAYDYLWRYSGDLYCMKHRNCPDDCRKTPCRLTEEE